MKKLLFKVEAKCGHVGKEYYIPVIFPVEAENGAEAARKVRQFPRVKHDHKDAILSVIQINKEEYLELVESNNNDPYLHCVNCQEQRIIQDIENRLIREKRKEFDEIELKMARKERVEYKQKKMRSGMVPFDYEE